MGCGSCGSGGCSSTPKGCNNNGGCSTGGCNKLNTYDWFGNMQQPYQTEFDNVYEIRFKGTRKAFYRNANGLSLITGDLVVVESDRGYDVGQISLGGILAKLQMKKRKVDPRSDRIRKIYRRATQEDLDKAKKAREREQETMVETRVIIRNLDLEMKLSDVELQGDNTKAIFYYIADQRVDFRELIKILADRFKIRVEMKQIGLRHEAGLVGGIGSCGRELCCSTWLTDFKSVSTSAARYQNLSLNPMKISGQCGRLKCCLNYELDTYLDALQDIPNVTRIETELGEAYLQKTDIFKQIMWFSYKGETSWAPLEVHKVVKMAEMNKKGERPASLKSLDEAIPEDEKDLDFVDVVGQAEIIIEPRRKRGGKKRRGPKGKGGQGQGQGQGQGRGRGRGKGGNQPKGEGKPQDGNQKPRGEKTQQDGKQPGGEGNKRTSNKRNTRSKGPRNQGGEAGQGGEGRSRNQNKRRGSGGTSKGRNPRGRGGTGGRGKGGGTGGNTGGGGGNPSSGPKE